MQASVRISSLSIILSSSNSFYRMRHVVQTKFRCGGGGWRRRGTRGEVVLSMWCKKIQINVYFTRQWLHYYCILLIKEVHIQIRSCFCFPIGLKNIMSLTTNIKSLINKILKTHCNIVFLIA